MRAPGVIILPSVLLSCVTASTFGCSSSRAPAADDGTASPPIVNPAPPSVADAGAGAADAADASEADASGFPPFECLDDDPAPVDAGVDAGDPTCPTSGPCSAECARIRNHYKLGVAETAIRCIKALPSCDEPADVHVCVDQALLATCADPTSTPFCSPLVSACDPNAGKPGSSIDQKGCEAVANGLSAAGRTAFANCINDKIMAGTCATEIVVCADQIRM